MFVIMYVKIHMVRQKERTRFSLLKKGEKSIPTFGKAKGKRSILTFEKKSQGKQKVRTQFLLKN